MARLVLATNNLGKLNELRALLSSSGIEVVGQREAGVIGEAVEDGASFVENAIIKARFAAAQCGFAALADDSGLCVDALDGMPGLYSARYSVVDGEAEPDDRALTDARNNQKLLDALAREKQRSARFVCVMAFVRHQHDPDPLIARGEWRGEIALKAHGEGGFGYDPVFVGEGLDVCAAQLTPDQKNERSHRGRALAAIIPQLMKWV